MVQTEDGNRKGQVQKFLLLSFLQKVMFLLQEKQFKNHGNF